MLRQTVRDTAWQLTARRGYDETTVEDIARGAGISVATFYRHFSGKEEVLTRRWLSEERLALLEPQIDRGRGLTGVVESLFDAYVRTVAVYQVDLITRLKVIHLDTGLQLAMTRGRREDTQTLAGLFAEIIGQPSDGLAMQLAAALTATARITAMSRWAALDGQLALGVLLKEVVETLSPSLDRCESAISASVYATFAHPTS